MSSLMRIPVAGGTPQKLTELNTPAKELTHRWPEVLPGGKAVVFVIGEAKDIGNYEEPKIAVERLDTHQRKILPILGTYPRYAPSGHLLYVREGRIFAVPFDLNRRSPLSWTGSVLAQVPVSRHTEFRVPARSLTFRRARSGLNGSWLGWSARIRFNRWRRRQRSTSPPLYLPMGSGWP